MIYFTKWAELPILSFNLAEVGLYSDEFYCRV